MDHRKWDSSNAEIFGATWCREHNDLYNDWKKSSLEAERLAKINGDMCDTIADLERELEAVTAQRNRLKMELSELDRELESVKAERDALQKRNDIQSGQLRRIDGEISPLMSEVSSLKSQLASTERQLADVGTELLAARAQPVKVKVRWDVTAEDISSAMRPWVWLAADAHWGKVLDYLAAHAVIDAPAGVPSVRDLREIGIREYLAHPHAAKENAGCIHDPMEAAATAIRDAVLAGMQSQQPVSTATPTPEQVEALAEELCDTAPVTAPWKVTEYKDEWRAIARAAIAHIQQPERPKGLPSADQFNTHFASIDRGLFEHDVIELIYDFLAPWLRDPVGWELDVTAEEALRVWGKEYGHPKGVQAVLDLCRSRIRPTFECKECADKERRVKEMSDIGNEFANKYELERDRADGLAAKIASFARAALEGE